MTVEELQEKQALVKKLKSELKNEEMALVLLKKLKQSQTAAAREVGQVVQGGATLRLGLGRECVGPEVADDLSVASLGGHPSPVILGQLSLTPPGLTDSNQRQEEEDERRHLQHC